MSAQQVTSGPEVVAAQLEAKVEDAKKRNGPLRITFGDIYAWVQMLRGFCVKRLSTGPREMDEGKCSCGWVPRHVAPDGCATFTAMIECPCGNLIQPTEKCETCGTALGEVRGGR